MGLGMTRDGKKLVCASATSYGDPIDTANAIVIDVNALFRKECIFTDAKVPPRVAVDIFFRRHIFPYKQCRYFGFYCDSSDRVPLERQTFLRERRYAPSSRPPTANQVQVDGRNYTRGTEPVQSDLVQKITADSIPAPWPRLWNSAGGKAKLWEVIADCIRDKVLRFAAPNTQYVIDPPRGPVWSYPAGIEKNHNYGEADSKCAEAALEIASASPHYTVVVKTIDWDMLVSGLYFPPNVIVSIGVVYVDGENEVVAYSKQKAPSSAHRVAEIVQPGRLSETNPATASFWLLAAVGVDYCDGLKRFGWKEGPMLEMLPHVLAEPFISVENPIGGGARRAVLDVKTLQKHLEATQRRVTRGARATNNSLADFQKELDRIWYCTLYYAGFDPQRDRGGPLLQDNQWFNPECSGIDELQNAAMPCVTVSYTENYPDAIPRYNRPERQ